VPYFFTVVDFNGVNDEHGFAFLFVLFITIKSPRVARADVK
jgi:hypothetical protein